MTQRPQTPKLRVRIGTPAAKKRLCRPLDPAYKQALARRPHRLSAHAIDSMLSKSSSGAMPFSLPRSRLRAGLGLAALLLASAASAAQGVADQLALCKTESAELQVRIEACTRTLEAAPDNEELRIEALLQRGVLYELTGDQEAAIADYSEIIKLDATSAIAHFNRGNVRDRLGQAELAIQDYSEAIRLDPNDPDTFNNRGQVYDTQGEFDLAISDYSEAIRLDSSNARAFYNRGLSYLGKGELRTALADFDQAIRLQPQDADAFAARAAAQEELGEKAAALADYRRALEIAPDHAEAKEAIERLGK